MKPLLAAVATGKPLTEAESRAAFDIIMSGEATPAQIGGFLMALRVRGETVEEITGAVQAMRARMLTVDAPEGAVDVVGTGGDGSGTFNISTTASFVVAGCGIPVAKHGNRALSSQSGSADVLAALGVRIDLSPERVAACIRDAGVGFMFAPAHHPAMKHVGPSRVELGTRTIFNLLGPLSNPAGVRRQLVGVFAGAWVVPVAETLLKLGSERALVVHSADGCDEMTTVGPNQVAELRDGQVTAFTLSAEDAGLESHQGAGIKGGDAAFNAEALRRVLAGERGAYRDTVIMNAGAMIVVAGRTESFREAAATAAAAIDDGHALAALDRLIAVSNG
jgi:anthranilate phosphoribosyltransferase